MLEALRRRADASAPLSSLDYARGAAVAARYYAAFSTASFSTATRAPSRAMV